ncbi:hypothetical protein SADUNF_Sadunf10G0109700 [Salix dunnii]|uniref:HIT-type domain-containing protein n=1 Tax=Salix dunnii TaxID=1413687 RepID=A0A835JTG6_9ROSI|nr:hypothetical protein SADUNF_Sadunf10G0109700 [Salix dunnii]
MERQKSSNSNILYLLHPTVFSSIQIKNKIYLVQAKAAKFDELGPNSVRWATVQTGTLLIIATRTFFVGFTQRGDLIYCHPPPREKCAGSNCTNAYKYQDLTSKLPLCSLHCYNAIHEKMQPSIARSMKEIDGLIIRNLVLLQ